MNILDNRIIAILRDVDAENIVDVINALLGGGIISIEIPLNHSTPAAKAASLRTIQKSHETFGDQIFLGAGTILSPEEAEAAANAGAKYIISPNMDPEVIKKTKSLGLASMPGAMTPSEIVDAYKNGADIVKIFPAGNLGTDYIKAIKGPLNFIPLAAVGGVNLENAGKLLMSGYQMIAVGGNLADKKAIQAGDYRKISSLARAYKEIVDTAV